MFWRRNDSGSMFASFASWSISCSEAKFVCGPAGARSVPDWNMPSDCVTVLPISAVVPAEARRG